jgi:PhoH-like ATPase
MSGKKKGVLDTNFASVKKKISEIESDKKVKVYIPDTNVLITNPFAPFILSGNEIPENNPDIERFAQIVKSLNIQYSKDPNVVAIVSVVENELNGVKDSDRKEPMVRSFALTAQRVLEDIVSADPKGSVQSGLKMDNDALFFRIHYRSTFVRNDFDNVTDRFEVDNDTKIVFSALQAQRQLSGAEVVFVSDDIGARMKARQVGVRAEPFRYEAIMNPDELYSGYQELRVPRADFNRFKRSKSVSIESIDVLRQHKKSLYPNQIVYLTSEHNNETISGIVNGKTGSVVKFTAYKPTLFTELKHPEPEHAPATVRRRGKARKQPKQRPKRRTEELAKLPMNLPFDLSTPQQALIELLMLQRVQCVSVIGTAGTGKTLCALLAGLKQVRNGNFTQLLYMRPLVTMGNEIGYLPGSKAKKMGVWADPVEDNLRVIFNYKDAGSSRRQRIDEYMRNIQSNGLITIEPPSFIPGRTICDTYMFIDEAHNFTREQMKMLLQRAGRGSKLVIAGDPAQIIGSSKSFVTQANNGLVHIVDKLPRHDNLIYAHFTLPKSDVKRSLVASLARYL